MIYHELYESFKSELDSEFRDTNYTLQESTFESFVKRSAVIYNIWFVWCDLRWLLSFLRLIIALQTNFVIRRFFKLNISRSVRIVFFISSGLIKSVSLYPRIILNAVYNLNFVIFRLTWMRLIRILKLFFSFLQVNEVARHLYLLFLYLKNLHIF